MFRDKALHKVPSKKFSSSDTPPEARLPTLGIFHPLLIFFSFKGVLILHFGIPASVSEVLHPSWQAKRKEKELHISVSGCQGKKIRFDDA